MKQKIKAKFPCGMEYEIELESLLGDYSLEWDAEVFRCPLHGKACKK